MDQISAVLPPFLHPLSSLHFLSGGAEGDQNPGRGKTSRQKALQTGKREVFQYILRLDHRSSEEKNGLLSNFVKTKAKSVLEKNGRFRVLTFFHMVFILFSWIATKIEESYQRNPNRTGRKKKQVEATRACIRLAPIQQQAMATQDQ